MARVKRGVIARARHKKVLKQAKGYYGARSRIYRVAVQAVTKAGQYAYRDRKAKKRVFRALWITRINAQARANGMTYSQLIAGLKGLIEQHVGRVAGLAGQNAALLEGKITGHKPGDQNAEQEQADGGAQQDAEIDPGRAHRGCHEEGVVNRFLRRLRGGGKEGGEGRIDQHAASFRIAAFPRLSQLGRR